MCRLDCIRCKGFCNISASFELRCSSLKAPYRELPFVGLQTSCRLGLCLPVCFPPQRFPLTNSKTGQSALNWLTSRRSRPRLSFKPIPPTVVYEHNPSNVIYIYFNQSWPPVPCRSSWLTPPTRVIDTSKKELTLATRSLAD